MSTITKRFARVVVAAVVSLGLMSADLFAQNTRGGGPFGGRGPGGGPGGSAGPGGTWGGRGRGGPGGPGGMLGPMGIPGALPMIAERLDLSDPQRDQVRRIMASHRDEMKALGDRSFEAHQALRATVIAEIVDEAAIRARSTEVAAVEADVAVAHARIHAEIWQILTPEQQDEARKLQAAISKQLEEGRERRSQRTPGPVGRRR